MCAFLGGGRINELANWVITGFSVGNSEWNPPCAAGNIERVNSDLGIRKS